MFGMVHRTCRPDAYDAEPPIRVVLQGAPHHFAPAARALQRGVQPQREQDARVDRRMSCVAAARLDRLVQLAQRNVAGARMQFTINIERAVVMPLAAIDSYARSYFYRCAAPTAMW